MRCEICNTELTFENGNVFCTKCKGLFVREFVYRHYAEVKRGNRKVFKSIQIISIILFVFCFLLPLTKTPNYSVISTLGELAKSIATLADNEYYDVASKAFFIDFLFSIPSAMLFGIIFTFLAALRQARFFIRFWAISSMLIVFLNVYGAKTIYKTISVFELYSIGFWAIVVGLNVCIIITFFFVEPPVIFVDTYQAQKEEPNIDGVCQFCRINPTKANEQFCEECEKEFDNANAERE